MTDRLLRWLTVPRDIAALAAFRIVFGLLIAVSATRFLVYGWVTLFYEQPRFHFTYWGLGWVQPLPGPGMHAVFGGLVVLGLLVAAGLFYRGAIAALFVVFTYVQAVDVTTYLNHYYLVSLLAGLLCFIPAHRAFSLDAWRKPGLRADSLPAWCTYLLRFQVAVVYASAGLAKLTGDWLLHAQPLSIWLTARTSLPLVGGFVDQPWVAYVAAWSGFLFDATIAGFLLWRRTRPLAYAAVIVFHAATALLFPIGMFPVIMITAAWVFFDSSWPRRWLPRGPAVAPAAQAFPRTAPAFGPWGRIGLAVAGVYCLAQLALPLRTHLYGGNVLWHEQGMRFSWRVMAREKNGSVTFQVRDPASGRLWHIPPSRYLNRIQEREMSVQPDLILQLAHRIARDMGERLGRPVEVRVDAVASLNGRAAARLIDPDVDLARIEDGLTQKQWILPSPAATPSPLRPTLARL